MLKLPDARGYDTASVQRWGPEKLAVYVIDAEGRRAPHHLSGKYSLQAGKLCFRPHFDLLPGGTFVVHAILGGDTTSRRFTVPQASGPLPDPAKITGIYPRARTIPANTLLFYVEFDAPMNPDDQAYRHVSFINDSGDTLRNVWRHKSHWLKNNTVLVLMLHPGRIKRGIDFMKELGEIFVPGQEYRLLVGNGLVDAHMQPLTATSERKYTITTEDREIPYCETNRFKAPTKPGSALVLAFSEPMDYATLFEGTFIRKKETGERIMGVFLPARDESTWKFVPYSPWGQGHYEVEFSPEVSDFAHNNLYRPFEITSLEELEKEKEPVVWEFELR